MLITVFWRKFLSVALAFLNFALTACMVGPNFKTPLSPNVAGYTEKPMPVKTVSAPSKENVANTQYFGVGDEIPAQWWLLFHSTVINDLISAGLANSPNLASASATLRQAQETLNAQIGALFFPAVNGVVAATRQQVSGISFANPNSGATIFNLYNVSANISYTLDVFGGARRQIEALRAQVDYQRFEFEAAQLTLMANIVTTVITATSLQAQVDATHELIRTRARYLQIVQKQFQLGGASGGDVLLQQSQLAQMQATLPLLEKSLAQSHHALAVLVGAFPSQSQLPRLDFTQLHLPTELPVSLPSSLVRQRPDIRAAEALLHQASAQIGVATANLFPQITLSGNYGWLASRVSDLFKSGSNVWSIGSQLTQPLFDGGSLLAKRRGAIAGYEAAFAQYRQVVLQAFQNVADTLRALETDARALRAQIQAEIAAKKSLNLVSRQLALGGVSYLTLLTAQQQYAQAKINRIQAQALRFADTAALFQALGGGWWNRQLICSSSPCQPAKFGIIKSGE